MNKALTRKVISEAVPLGTVVDALRRDLIKSMESHDCDWEPLFELQEATVELNVTLKQNDSRKGGIAAWVLSGEIVSGRTRETTHKLTLKLLPIRNPEEAKKQVKLGGSSAARFCGQGSRRKGNRGREN